MASGKKNIPRLENESEATEPQEKLQLPIEVPRYSAVEPQEKLQLPIEVPRYSAVEQVSTYNPLTGLYNIAPDLKKFRKAFDIKIREQTIMAHKMYTHLSKRLEFKDPLAVPWLHLGSSYVQQIENMPVSLTEVNFQTVCTDGRKVFVVNGILYYQRKTVLDNMVPLCGKLSLNLAKDQKRFEEMDTVYYPYPGYFVTETSMKEMERLSKISL